VHEQCSLLYGCAFRKTVGWLPTETKVERGERLKAKEIIRYSKLVLSNGGIPTSARVNPAGNEETGSSFPGPVVQIRQHVLGKRSVNPAQANDQSTRRRQTISQPGAGRAISQPGAARARIRWVPDRSPARLHERERGGERGREGERGGDAP
jgi:hypothetical protein